MYHDVPRRLLGRFKDHLQWLAQRFDFLSPEGLLNEASPGKRPMALLTFDDGCLDNYELVAPLLESFGFRGLFFVCPGFTGLSREASFRLMERSSLLFGEKARDSRWQRLSRDQIVDLDRRGHAIGSHTLTHTPLILIDETEARREIQQSASLLVEWLGHPCRFFAWTYAWNQVTSQSLAVAAENHTLLFSPCSGLNDWPLKSRLIWRTGVDVSKPVSHLQTQLSGLVDHSYKIPRSRLQSMMKELSP